MVQVQELSVKQSELPEAPSVATNATSSSSSESNRQDSFGMISEKRSVVLIAGAGTPVGTSLALAFASNANYELALLDSNADLLSKVASLVEAEQTRQAENLNQKSNHKQSDCNYHRKVSSFDEN